MSRVKSITYAGVQPTLDLEVDHPDHQFYLANGVLTSNSHATSYAIISYYCAWLLYHHPAEWLCAYMEDSAEKEGKRSKAMQEITAYGFSIKNIDVNYATAEWTILPNKTFMPSLLTVKGIGVKAVEELVALRPFASIDEMLWTDEGEWRWSKFNKRAWDALIKIEAFESLGCVGSGRMFDDYHHMHRVIIEHYNDLRKPGGRSTFQAIIDLERGQPDWSRSQKIEHYKEVIGHANLDLMISPEARERLRKNDVLSIDHLDEDDTEDVVWFVINDVLPKLTKTGKQYILLNVSGEFGNVHRIYCWGASHSMVEKFRPGRVGVGQVKRSDFGFGAQAWKLKFIGD